MHKRVSIFKAFSCKRVLIAAGSVLLWAGCYAMRPSPTWEYKVVYPSGHGGDANRANTANDDPKTQEMFLNDLAKDGWIFVEKDASGLFYFKRAKR